MPVVEAPRRLGWILLVAACAGAEPEGDKAAVSATEHVVVARSLVADVARSTGVTPERAADLAAEDALLAAHLERERPAAARALASVALSRALLADISAAARAAGAPTDAELQEIQRERWWELDRPRMLRLLHAVVLSEKEDAKARALAERIRQAAAPKPNPEFRKTAREVEAAGFTVKTEKLYPMAPDGRAVDLENPPPAGPPVQHFASEFAEAALRLTRSGQTSPVVRTPFGYHVIRLTGIIEPKKSSLDELRTTLVEEVVERRARAAIDEVLTRQRREAAPEQERSALALMGQFEPAR